MQILTIIAGIFHAHHTEPKPVVVPEVVILTQGFEAIYVPEDAEAPFVAIPADERVF